MITQAYKFYYDMHKYPDQTDMLWHAADQVVDFILKEYEKDYDMRMEFQPVIYNIQAAAISCHRGDMPGVQQYLSVAAGFTTRADLREDIYRMMARLGLPCQVHGKETFVERTGGFHFAAGEVWDDIVDHVYCSICGEEIEIAKQAHVITSEDEIL